MASVLCASQQQHRLGADSGGGFANGRSSRGDAIPDCWCIRRVGESARVRARNALPVSRIGVPRRSSRRTYPGLDVHRWAGCSHLHRDGMDGPDGGASYVRCFTWDASYSGGHRSGSSQPDCRCRNALLVHRPEPSPAFRGYSTAVGKHFQGQVNGAMMRAPTSAEIDAVELRLLQSRRNVRQSIGRTGSALRAAITRPSTVVLVAVAAGISAFWLVRRRRPSSAFLSVGAATATRAARPGVVRTFISRHETQLLAYVLQQVTAAWQKRRSYVHSGVARTPSPPDAANAGDRDPNSDPTRVG